MSLRKAKQIAFALWKRASSRKIPILTPERKIGKERNEMKEQRKRRGKNVRIGSENSDRLNKPA